MAEDLTEQSEEYKAVIQAMVGSIPVEVPFWERAQIRPRELTALQLEKRKLEQQLEEEAWHAVQDTMPDDDITVLVYSTKTEVYMLAYHSDGKWVDIEDGSDYYTGLMDITHWKDLIPPKGAK